MKPRVLWAILALALLLPRLALAEEAIDRRYVPDRPLGSGLCKTVYSVKDRSDLVIAVANPLFGRTMARELEGLKTLRQHGIPTVEVHAHGRTADGRRAMVMTRYAAGSKDPAVWSYLNQRSLDGMQRISALLREKRLLVDDIQYLVRRDGSLVVADPLRVKKKWLRPGQQTGSMAKPRGRGFMSFAEVRARIRGARPLESGLTSRRNRSAPVRRNRSVKGP